MVRHQKGLFVASTGSEPVEDSVHLARGALNSSERHLRKLRSALKKVSSTPSSYLDGGAEIIQKLQANIKTATKFRNRHSYELQKLLRITSFKATARERRAILRLRRSPVEHGQWLEWVESLPAVITPTPTAPNAGAHPTPEPEMLTEDDLTPEQLDMLEDALAGAQGDE
jgi:hypothetical protein